MLPPPPRSTLFPYTTLFRSTADLDGIRVTLRTEGNIFDTDFRSLAYAAAASSRERLDRKSTRLNSSHVEISYAVFCLKKKKRTASATTPAASAVGPTPTGPL